LSDRPVRTARAILRTLYEGEKHVNETIKQTSSKPGRSPDRTHAFKIIKQMINDGLVVKSKTTKHKEKRVLSLTEAGKALAAFAKSVEGFKQAYEHLRAAVHTHYDTPRKNPVVVKNRLRSRQKSSEEIESYDDRSTDITLFQLSAIKRFLDAINSKYLELTIKLQPKGIVKDLLTSIHGEAVEYISTVASENMEHLLTNEIMRFDDSISQREAGDCFNFVRKYPFLEGVQDNTVRNEMDGVVESLYRLSNPPREFIEPIVNSLDTNDPAKPYLKHLMENL
jgi:DNA-binding HxlR family transcriptional regulator